MAHCRKIAKLVAVLMMVAWPLGAAVGAEETKEAGLEKALEVVEKATQHHVEALEALLEEVPEEARPAIEHAINVSKHGKSRALEAVDLARTEHPQERASLYQKQAEKRIAEMRELGAGGKPEFAETLGEGYRSSLRNTFRELEKARQQGADVSEALEAVSAATEKHQEVMRGVLGKVPKEAKPAIRRAIQVSGRGREAARNALRKAQQARERRREAAGTALRKAQQARERRREAAGTALRKAQQARERRGPSGTTGPQSRSRLGPREGAGLPGGVREPDEEERRQQQGGRPGGRGRGT